MGCVGQFYIAIPVRLQSMWSPALCTSTYTMTPLRGRVAKPPRRARSNGSSNARTRSSASASASVSGSTTAVRRRSALQERMAARLAGAKFRMLNESLYTQTGAESFRQLQESPSLFQEYHEGFSLQSQSWPRSPVSDVISVLKTMPSALTIADFGCGDAQIARDVPQTVRSFDLVSSNPQVEACDVRHTPLSNEEVDIVVICLALMGTDYPYVLTEARRVLKTGGVLLVAEVASRFERHDPAEFVNGVQALGFKRDMQHPLEKALRKDKEMMEEGKHRKTKGKKKDRSGNRKGTKFQMNNGQKSNLPLGSTSGSAFFYYFAFEKAGSTPKNDAQKLLPLLKPCLYKKR